MEQHADMQITPEDLALLQTVMESFSDVAFVDLPLDAQGINEDAIASAKEKLVNESGNTAFTPHEIRVLYAALLFVQNQTAQAMHVQHYRDALTDDDRKVIAHIDGLITRLETLLPTP